LKKLSAMIKAGKITLLITDQVKDEFFRNRENKIYDALKTIRDTKIKQDFPRFLLDYSQCTRLREIQKEYEKEHKDLLINVLDDIKNRELAADKLVIELFNVGEQLKHNEENIRKARQRIEIGAPPGKNGSLGDAINWEMLIEYGYASWDDLYFISADKDYSSHLYEETLNEYLQKEWTEKNKSKIHYFSRLSQFFKKMFPAIEFDENIERQILVSNLCEAASFKGTHKAIMGLIWEDTFTKKEIDLLFMALIENSQINGIIDDADVDSFYKQLWKDYRKHLDTSLVESVESILFLKNRNK
jgi:hypothetical protein